MSAELDAIIARAEKGEATIRDGQYILNGLQNERDRLGAMLDLIDTRGMAHDPRIIIRVDDNPKLYRFSNIDALADWLAKGWK
jgi:hypothetical protein